MPQQIVYTNEEENKKVNRYSKIWKLSKAETIKKIIREFKKEVKK